MSDEEIIEKIKTKLKAEVDYRDATINVVTRPRKPLDPYDLERLIEAYTKKFGEGEKLQKLKMKEQRIRKASFIPKQLVQKKEFIATVKRKAKTEEGKEFALTTIFICDSNGEIVRSFAQQ